MSRLIAVDVYKKRIDRYPPEIRDTAKKELRYTPAVDAVEVVWCKDCKHSEEALLPNQELWCKVKDTFCTSDWFCADGKRRDKEDECFVCKYRNKRDSSKDTPYCLHCNVRMMRGEENERSDKP